MHSCVWFVRAAASANRGGVVRSWQLKKYTDGGNPPRVLDLVNADLARQTDSWPLSLQFADAQPLIEQFRQAGRFSQVHLYVFDGRIGPSIWDDGGGPDSFEVEIGNRFAHSLPLREAGPRFRDVAAPAISPRTKSSIC